jgi:hypothetical protein
VDTFASVFLLGRPYTKACIDALCDLMTDAAPWECIQQEFSNVEYRSIAFGMLARALAGIEQLLASKLYPLKLFRLIRSPELAAEIASDPVCLLDSFSKIFRTTFRTPAQLESDDCRAELLAASAIHRTEIIRVECRHSFLRRHIKSTPQRKGRSIMDTSAAFVLMRQRCVERASWWSRRRNDVETDRTKKVKTISSGKFKGNKTGGGGKRRAALSNLFKELNVGGSKLSKEELSAKFSEAHRLANAAPEERQVSWSDLGNIGTESHRAGAQCSFGRKVKVQGPRKQNKSKPPVQALPQPADANPVVEPALDNAQAAIVVADLARDSSLQLALMEFKSQAKQTRSDQIRKREELQTWSSDRVENSQQLGEIAAASTSLPTPLGPPGLPLDYHTWIPPATEMAKRMLGGQRRCLGREFNLRLQLHQAWSKRHIGIISAHQPKIPVVTQKVSECYVAGFCVCKPSSGNLRRFVQSLEERVLSKTRGWLKPKADLRLLYDSAKASLCALPQ